MIDRVSQAARPRAVAIGYQSWRDLLFLHWPVPVAALRPLVPASLEIDVHEGTAYVGLVPFAMQGVRFIGTPRALALAFLETNVRTYVHVEGRDPGVYFFSLDAASRLAVHAARASFGLPYHAARMSLRRDGAAIDYALRRAGPRRPSLAVRYEPLEPLGPSQPGTLDHFLIERYLLHVERAGRLWTGQVNHRPYPCRRVRVERLEEDLVAAAGLTRPPGPAPIAHYSPGVDVEIFAPWPRRRG